MPSDGQARKNKRLSGPTAPGEALRQRAIRLEYFTVGWSVLEAIVALVAGGAVLSIALIAFGLDSVIEAASGATLLWRFKQQRLEDQEADSRALKIVGITFFVLSAFVGYEATIDLWLHRAPKSSPPGIILAGVALVIMCVLGIAKRRLARALNSRALLADSVETLVCGYFSAILLIGLSLSAWFGWWWADPIAALVMVVLMVHEGMEALSGGEQYASEKAKGNGK